MAWPNGPLQRAMGDFESWLAAVLTVMQFVGPWAVSLMLECYFMLSYNAAEWYFKIL